MHRTFGRSRHRTRLVPVTSRTHWLAMTHTVRNVAWQIPVLLLGLAVFLAGCGDKPDAAACEQAMRKQLSAGIEAQQNGTQTTGTKPPECNGLSDAELQRIGEKVLGDQLGTTPSP